MSGTFRDITKKQNLQQTGKPPTTKAVEPVLGLSAVAETVDAGEVTPRVVILTALPEEFLAVEKHLSACKEIKHPEGTVYTFGKFVSGDASWEVVIVETGQGNRKAATETQRAINKFNPDIVLFVGVAGGRKETQIGDVVAANKVYNYESGRDELEFKYRPESERVSYPLEQQAKAVVRDWLRRKGKENTEDLPHAFVGAIAAGGKVVASTDSVTSKRIEEGYGDARAVEMEGYGFLGAAREVKNVPALVIRGISDLIDGKEEADKSGSQPLAARNASKFAFELLARLEGATAFSKDNVAKFEAPSVELEVDEKPLSEIAIVWFQKYEGSYHVIAQHQAMKRFEETAPQLTLPIQIGSFISKFPWTLDTVGDLELYDPQGCLIGGLLKWLSYLKNIEPLFSCLVIKESHRSIVPWELLNLNRQALGVTLQTVRSQFTADDNLTTQAQLWQTDSHYCEGQAIVYCPSKRGTGVEAYLPDAQSYLFDSFSHEDPEQILVHLQKVKHQVGLVVMSDSELQKVTQKRRTVYLKRTTVWKDNASLVMLQMAAGKDDGTTQREWAAALLNNGARGVLSMMESLNDSISQKIVHAFFAEYKRDPNLPIPEILRRLRTTFAKKLDNDLKDDISPLYLAAFLYAYYGHPRAMLRLTSSVP
ncbi:MAG: hypothetical protein AAFN38_21135 [Cyanobacteria bacterium J06560_5]